MSPDFRQRASSNASSCGRLSPIPALIGLEPDWSFGADYTNTTITPAQAASMEQLAGSIAEVKLPKDILQGSVANFCLFHQINCVKFMYTIFNF